jgi:hypothetical protein
MAEQTAQDVVTQAQSTSDSPLDDGPASTQTPVPALEAEAATNEGSTDSGANTTSIQPREVAKEGPVEGDDAVLGTRRDPQDAADPAPATTQEQSADSAPVGSVAVSEEAPDNSRDAVSIGDANSVQSNEDAGEAGLADTEVAVSAEADHARKSEGAEQRPDRLSAIKKPAAFKAVSVTKTYLAKTGTGPVVATKSLGDKCKLAARDDIR